MTQNLRRLCQCHGGEHRSFIAEVLRTYFTHVLSYELGPEADVVDLPTIGLDVTVAENLSVSQSSRQTWLHSPLIAITFCISILKQTVPMTSHRTVESPWTERKKNDFRYNLRNERNDVAFMIEMAVLTLMQHLFRIFFRFFLPRPLFSLSRPRAKEANNPTTEKIKFLSVRFSR